MVPYYVYNRIGFPRLCNRLDRIVAVSPTVKGMYVENGINGQLVEIIPHFIETSFAGEGTKTADDHLRIIYVGRLERFKGVRFLFGAMERAVFDEKKCAWTSLATVVRGRPQRGGRKASTTTSCFTAT